MSLWQILVLGVCILASLYISGLGISLWIRKLRLATGILNGLLWTVLVLGFTSGLEAGVFGLGKVNAANLGDGGVAFALLVGWVVSLCASNYEGNKSGRRNARYGVARKLHDMYYAAWKAHEGDQPGPKVQTVTIAEVVKLMGDMFWDDDPGQFSREKFEALIYQGPPSTEQ